MSSCFLFFNIPYCEMARPLIADDWPSALASQQSTTRTQIIMLGFRYSLYTATTTTRKGQDRCAVQLPAFRSFSLISLPQSACGLNRTEPFVPSTCCRCLGCLTISARPTFPQTIMPLQHVKHLTARLFRPISMASPSNQSYSRKDGRS